MTSSLVGSEMCIRDRTCSVDALGRGVGELWKCSSYFASVDHAWRCASAVSYTHLTLPTICSV
eukprot:694392-Prorocentrum_lima.AAC.1